jgi:hypothetical protein
MARWFRCRAGVVGAGTLAGALAVGVASRRWQAATERLVQQLMGAAAVPPQTVSFQALDSLPAPVRRYFRVVLRDGQPYLRSARVRQAGEFRSEETADTAVGWQPFEATQTFTAEPPGFVWDARIRMAPLLNVWVRDGYVGGRASMLGSLLAVIRVVEGADGPELQAGALQRYLAESVWFPTALLPSERLSWSPMDESHARATLSDGESSVALEFEFGPSGEVVSAYTPGRQRAAPGGAGTSVTLPWGGRYRRYQEQGGMRVPVESEVYWMVDGREQPYYRGRSVGIEYDFGEDRR